MIKQYILLLITFLITHLSITNLYTNSKETVIRISLCCIAWNKNYTTKTLTSLLRRVITKSRRNVCKSWHLKTHFKAEILWKASVNSLTQRERFSRNTARGEGCGVVRVNCATKENVYTFIEKYECALSKHQL